MTVGAWKLRDRRAVDAPLEWPHGAVVRLMSIEPPAMTLTAVSGMDRAAFTAALGGVFEYSPWVAEAAWLARPFADVGALHRAMVAAVCGASDARQLDLIRAHPDLAGQAKRGDALTADSAAEQRSAGLLSLGDAEYDRLHRLNTAYRERFGFPFVIAVRRHTTASLLAAFEARLGHSRGAEIEAALQEIFTITRLRLDLLFAAGEAAA